MIFRLKISKLSAMCYYWNYTVFRTRDKKKEQGERDC